MGGCLSGRGPTEKRGAGGTRSGGEGRDKGASGADMYRTQGRSSIDTTRRPSWLMRRAA